jgi:hypothetical protein
MEGDVRYKVEHIGDSFVDILEKVFGSARECSLLKKVPDAARASVEAIKKTVPDVAKASVDVIKKAVPDAARASVDAIKKVPGTIKDPLGLLKKVPDAAKSSARGVILTYDIHELRKKKQDIVRQIGERIVEIRKESPEMNAADDEKMRTFLLEIDAIDSKLDDYINEREERLYPAKEKEAAEEAPAPEEGAEVSAEEPVPEEHAEVSVEEPVPEGHAEVSVEEPVPEEHAEVSVEEPVPEEHAEVSAGEPVPEEESKPGEIEILSGEEQINEPSPKAKRKKKKK